MHGRGGFLGGPQDKPVERMRAEREHVRQAADSRKLGLPE